MPLPRRSKMISRENEREPAQEPLVTRLLPDDLDVGVPRLQVDKVDRAVAQHLVCEPSAVLRPRVPRLRKLHPAPLSAPSWGPYTGFRSSGRPATPCRNPSNRLSCGPPCETRPARASSSATSSPPAWSSRPAPRRRADGSSTARSPCRTDRTSDGANAHHPGAALGHEPRSERTPPPIAAMHVLSQSCADSRRRLRPRLHAARRPPFSARQPRPATIHLYAYRRDPDPELHKLPHRTRLES